LAARDQRQRGDQSKVSLGSHYHQQPIVCSLTRQRGPSGAARQAAALRREGVEVTQNAMGEFLVDFGQYGWFPPVLPSETEEADSSDEDEDEDEGEDEEAADAAAYHT
jgi:hypothetical protein